MTDAGPPGDCGERLVTLVHDLRSPLTVVAGFADLLEARGGELGEAERAEYIRRVAESAREMRAILDAERYRRLT